MATAATRNATICVGAATVVASATTGGHALTVGEAGRYVRCIPTTFTCAVVSAVFAANHRVEALSLLGARPDVMWNGVDYSVVTPVTAQKSRQGSIPILASRVGSRMEGVRGCATLPARGLSGCRS